jgi:hypothetical protein
MPVYTVHAPRGGSTQLGATDRFAFVRDGFHLWAAILGPLWLAWHRLWLALLGWIVAIVALEVILLKLGANGASMLLSDLLLALLLGFEAASLRRWTLSRRNWRQLEIVVADDREQAERRFFDRWTALEHAAASPSSTIDRGAPPANRSASGQPSLQPPPLPHDSIIGLFPQPGGSR